MWSVYRPVMDGNRVRLTGPASFYLNRKRYETLAAEHGWTTNEQHALATGLSMGTISRIRQGRQEAATSRIMASLLMAFPEIETLPEFLALFEVVPVGQARPVAA